MELVESTNGVTVFDLLPHELRFIERALRQTHELDSAMIDGITPEKIARISGALAPRVAMDHSLLADLAKVVYEAARGDDSPETEALLKQFDLVVETVLSPADAAAFQRMFG